MDRANQAMVRQIKDQVLAELAQNRKTYSSQVNDGGYQAYRQLVNAVREEVLWELGEENRVSKQRLTSSEMEMIKRDVLRDLRTSPKDQES